MIRKKLIIFIIIMGAVLTACSNSNTELQRQEESKQQKEVFEEEFFSVVNDIRRMNEDSNYVVQITYYCWKHSFKKYSPEFNRYFQFLVSEKEPEYEWGHGTISIEVEIFEAIWDSSISSFGRSELENLLPATTEMVYSFRDKYKEIKEIKGGLKERIRLLKEYGSEMNKEQMELLESLYVGSVQYAELALSPGGSYNSYVSNVNSYTSTIDGIMKKLDLYLPDETESANIETEEE